VSAAESKASFFRQSGWMVMATVGGGVFMTAVHPVAARMGEGEYGVFATLLKCLILLNIPAGALQTVFTQQTAAAHDPVRERELAGTTRVVLAGIFVLWLAMLLPVFLFKQTLRDTLKISTDAAVWMTMLIALTALWTPVIKGLLQGRQNFLGLGWVAVFDGVGRFLAACVLVIALQGQSASGMLAAVIGQVIALAAGVWWTW
jgi:O-antigen/teichoic acid export membrane protein